MKILENYTGKDITTMRVGGPIKLIYLPDNAVEFIELLETIQGEYKVLGNGSNVIIKEDGCTIPIIINKTEEKWILEDDMIWASSGTSLSSLAQFALQNELTGLEFLAEIPGTVGGAVYMNAGAWGGEISKVVTSAVLLRDREIIELENEQLHFTYRHSVLHETKNIVLATCFQLKKDTQQNILSKLQKFSEMRKNTQPVLEQYPSSGSIFKNLSGSITELAGTKIGDAEISTLNPGFIINKGNATSNDVITLIEWIQSKIGGELEVEII